MNLRIILYEETEYVKRVEAAFSDFQSEKFELYCFHHKENLLAYFSLHEADVIVTSENIEIPEEIQEKFPVLYLSEQPETGKKQVFRYQKLEKFLEEIKRKVKKQNEKTKLLIFTSMQGGCGVTTSARAASLFLSEHGRSVAYLDFSFPGIRKNALSGEEKNKYGVIEVPVFLGDFGTPVDVEKAAEIVDELQKSKKWEYLVVDFPMYLDILIEILKTRADDIVYVCDGSEEGNRKFMQGAKLWGDSVKKWILYNRFDEQGVQKEVNGYEPLGGIMENSSSDMEKNVEKAANLSVFETFLG